jgi:hypothetical protein
MLQSWHGLVWAVLLHSTPLLLLQEQFERNGINQTVQRSRACVMQLAVVGCLNLVVVASQHASQCCSLLATLL